MLITVTTVEGGVYPLDIADDLPLEELKALLAMETGIALDELVLLHNMAPLTKDKETVSQCGVRDGDIIVAAEKNPYIQFPPNDDPPQTHSHAGGGGTGMSLPSIDWSSVQIPPASRSGAAVQQQPAGILPFAAAASASTESPLADPESFTPEALVQHFLSNPEELSALQQRNPRLAAALASGDVELVNQALLMHKEQLIELERERQQLEGLDPMSAEYQERLAENIRQRNIRENYEAAYEFNPEIIAGSVTMLYIQCKVNGIPVKALVDTGAQMTIMNVQCAERCHIMRLVDRRLAGVAFGVGRQRIIGTIHMGQIQIGNDFLASSFRVLETQSHELILGLDMLKRHQCIIDLRDHVLRVGTTGTQTDFLTATEIGELAAVYKQEEKGAIEDEDREMASIIARSEQEYQDKTGELPPPSPPSVATPTFPEEHIQAIIRAGFSREEALEGLQTYRGDLQRTLAALLAKSIKF